MKEAPFHIYSPARPHYSYALSGFKHPIIADYTVVSLKNLGPGPALDIGVTLLDASSQYVREHCQQVEAAWKTGKAAGMSSMLGQFNCSELAPKENTAGNPHEISLPLTPGRAFVVVIECQDVYRNIIGSYRAFRVLEIGGGSLKIEVTQTVSGQKVHYRIRSY